MTPADSLQQLLPGLFSGQPWKERIFSRSNKTPKSHGPFRFLHRLINYDRNLLYSKLLIKQVQKKIWIAYSMIYFSEIQRKFKDFESNSKYIYWYFDFCGYLRSRLQSVGCWNFFDEFCVKIEICWSVSKTIWEGSEKDLYHKFFKFTSIVGAESPSNHQKSSRHTFRMQFRVRRFSKRLF